MKNNTPYRLAFLMGFALLAACETTYTANSTSNPMVERAKIVASHVINTYDADGPGAAYLIARNGEILASGGVGYADLEWNVKIDADTEFRLGSMSKSITSIAVIQLVEQGLINLDLPISTYAPDLPSQIGAATLRQLLSHRSGLAEHVWNPDLLPFIWQPMTTQQVIDLQKDVPIDFAPGEEYNYVNFNYVVVAHVIEKVIGKTYIEFINQDIFAAQGMLNSHYDVHDTIIPGRAEFYDERDGVVLNSQDIDLSHVSAAGALLSSVTDMAHWMQLLVDGELISKTSLNEAWTPASLPDGTTTKYGLGFNASDLAGEHLIWHTGLTPGSQGAFSYAPEAGLFVIILSNGFYTPNTGSMSDDMMTIMITGELPKENTSVTQ